MITTINEFKEYILNVQSLKKIQESINIPEWYLGAKEEYEDLISRQGIRQANMLILLYLRKIDSNLTTKDFFDIYNKEEKIQEKIDFNKIDDNEEKSVSEKEFTDLLNDLKEMGI